MLIDENDCQFFLKLIHPREEKYEFVKILSFLKRRYNPIIFIWYNKDKIDSDIIFVFFILENNQKINHN